MRDPDFLRNKEFPFGPITEVVKNINFCIVTKESDGTNTSLAASSTKSTNEPHPQVITVDNFGSYQKFLRITAFILRLLPSHECYRNIDSSIIDPTELDEAERHVQYLVQEESLLPKEKIFWKINPLNEVAKYCPIFPLRGIKFSIPFG